MNEYGTDDTYGPYYQLKFKFAGKTTDSDGLIGKNHKYQFVERYGEYNFENVSNTGVDEDNTFNYNMISNVTESVDILDNNEIVANNKEYLKQNLNFGLQGEVNVSSYTFTGHLTHQLNIGNRDLSFQGRFTDGKNIHRFKGIEQIQNTTWLGVGVGKKLSNKFELSFNIDLRLDDYKKADTIFMTQLQYRF